VAENIKITIEAEDKASPVLSSIQSSLSNLNRNVSSNTSAMSSSFSALNRSLGNLESAFSAVAGAFFVKETVSFVNTIQTLDNKLRLVTNSSQELNATYDSLFEVAQRTRQGIAPTIDLYSKLALTADQVGIKQSDLSIIVEAFNKTLLKSGSSAQGAAAALYQIGQAMGSGRLQGQELVSQLENNAAFMMTLSRATGLTYAQLRKFATDGLLTSALVAQALKDDLGRLNAEIDKMPKTLSQSVTALSNAFQKTVRDILDTTDGANLMSRAVDALAANIKPLTYAMVALAAAFTIAALIKAVIFVVEAFTVVAVAATVATRGLSTALVFLASTPLGRIISLAGVAAGAVLTFGESSDATGKSSSYLSQGLDWLGKKLGLTSTETKKTTKDVGSFKQQIIEAFNAQQKGLPISTEMADLLKKLGITAAISKTPLEQ
jgi:tape measure domain-containing protein